MTSDQLVRLAVRIAAAPSLWRPVLRHDRLSRCHVRLSRDEDHEVWLLGWTAQQAVELHDHGGSAGAFAVVQGQLVEDDFGPRGLRQTRWPAGTARALPAACVHHVWYPGPAPASSIHVYSPPLSSMTYYERVASGALWAVRTERFDETATVQGELHPLRRGHADDR
jgi:hypothetical protein